MGDSNLKAFGQVKPSLPASKLRSISDHFVENQDILRWSRSYMSTRMKNISVRAAHEPILHSSTYSEMAVSSLLLRVLISPEVCEYLQGKYFWVLNLPEVVGALKTSGVKILRSMNLRISLKKQGNLQ